MGEQLRPEVTALIHHVELNDSDWWHKSLRRFILGAVLASSSASTPQTVAVDLRVEYGLEVAFGSVELEIEAMLEEGTLLDGDHGGLMVSEACRADLTNDVALAIENDRNAQASFDAHLERNGVEMELADAWVAFEDDFLEPLVRELGARTYELLTGLHGSSASLEAFVARLTEKHGQQFADSVVAFLDPDDPVVRKYVLRKLNAFFFIRAASLDEESLDRLGQSLTRNRTVRVFLDTNFLFSILRLHDNPANELAEAFDKLIQSVRNRIDLRLYVLPITVDETKRVLRYQMVALQGIRLPRNFALAVSDFRITGLMKRYLDEVAKSPGLKADDFFGPYEADLVPILRERGVELFNESMDEYRTDQAVIDDLLAQQSYQEEHRPGGAKPYETNLHDMVLWHSANRKRPATVESPLDLGIWIVTADYGLVRFDRWKRHEGEFPLCLTPTSLIQILQFFVPQSDDLSRALIGSLRLPFLFPDFDPEAERVTARILRKLSRFEGASDLAPETVREILMNDALRRRVSRAEAEEDQEAAVQEALVDELRAMEERLKAEKEEASAQVLAAADAQRVLGDELTATKDEAAELAAQAAALKEENDERDRQLQELRERLDALATANSRASAAEEQVNSLQDTLASQAADHLRDRYSTRLSLVAVTLVIVAIGASIGLHVLGWPAWLAIGAAAIGSLSLWLLLADLMATHPTLSDTRLVKVVRAGRFWVAAPFALVLLSAISSFLYAVASGSR